MSTNPVVEIPEGYVTPSKFFEGIEGQLIAMVDGVRVIALNHTGNFPDERLHVILENGTHLDDLRNAVGDVEYAEGVSFEITVRMISDAPKT